MNGQVVDVLEENEDGLTTREVVEALGEPLMEVRNDLVRLHLDNTVEKQQPSSIDENALWVLTENGNDN